MKDRHTRIDTCGHYPDEVGLVVGDHGEYGDIFSLYHEEDGTVRFMEECDGYYTFNTTRENAIAILEKCIAYVKGDG